MSKTTKSERITQLEQIAVDQARAFKIMADRLNLIEVESKWIIHMTGIERSQLKQLDQSVFNGLDEKWRFAAIDGERGIVTVFDLRPMPSSCNNYHTNTGEGNYKDLYELTGYDTTDWQNSLIERDTAKELTGSELCKAMLARGDKYISGFGHHHSDRLALESKFADTVSKHTQCFQSSQNAWDYFVPINNQGEPLTATEVGL